MEIGDMMTSPFNSLGRGYWRTRQITTVKNNNFIFNVGDAERDMV
jgi:hypothetical protein